MPLRVVFFHDPARVSRPRFAFLFVGAFRVQWHVSEHGLPGFDGDAFGAGDEELVYFDAEFRWEFGEEE